MCNSENEEKKQVVTCAEMKEIEREANANGLSYYQMKENAGTAAADIILSQETEPASLTAVIFCGKGNNGGDGYVVARSKKSRARIYALDIPSAAESSAQK